MALQDALVHAKLSQLPSEAVIEAEQGKLRTQREECQRARAKLTGIRNAEDEVLETAVRARAGAEAELGELRRTLLADLSTCRSIAPLARTGRLRRSLVFRNHLFNAPKFAFN